MKLRTKSVQSQPLHLHTHNATPKCNNQKSVDHLPSTSKIPPTSAYNTRRSSTASIDQLSTSPDSPGISSRIAKSNARLLNGLDLNYGRRTGVYLYDTVGVIPELKTFELNEKCPFINKLIRYNEKDIDPRQLDLTGIQFELEEVLAENVNYQKTIHGEVTYLTTGEYPTSDLKDRIMPLYGLIDAEEFKKITGRAKQLELNNTTNASLADIGIMSSPEEDDTPNILDVPQRFWTWAKEYLRPISIDYVQEFKKLIVNRFSDNQILQKYCGIDKAATSKKSVPVLSSNCALKRKHNSKWSSESFQDESSAKKPKLSLNNSPQSLNHRRKNVNSFNNHTDHRKTAYANRNSSTSASSCACHNGLYSTLHGCNITGNSTSHGYTTKKSRKMGIQEKAPKNLETPKRRLNRKNKHIEDCEEQREEKTVNGGLEMESDEHEEEEEIELKYTPGTNAGNDDEVSSELIKKQAQLRELFAQTRPLIERLNNRVLTEYAIHEIYRRIDDADNKLFQLGSKYERLHQLNKEQRLEVKMAVQYQSQIQEYLRRNRLVGNDAKTSKVEEEEIATGQFKLP